MNRRNNRRMSQKQKVLEILENEESIDALTAFRRGCGMRLSALIWALRKEGHEIHTELSNNVTGHATYTMKS